LLLDLRNIENYIQSESGGLHSEQLHTTISPFVFNHLWLDLPPFFVLRSGVTKWAKRMVREKELEDKKEIVSRRMYRGKKWLKEFAIGIRLIELAWIDQIRYHGNLSKKLEYD
jgi:hypothetical protein